MYINDTNLGITSQLRLFADDCILYRVISDQQDQLLTTALPKSYGEVDSNLANKF